MPLSHNWQQPANSKNTLEKENKEDRLRPQNDSFPMNLPLNKRTERHKKRSDSNDKGEMAGQSGYLSLAEI